MFNRHSIDWYCGYYRDGPLVSPLRTASLCGLRREYFRKRLPAIL